MARKNFTSAIKYYLDNSPVTSGVNLYSLATRVLYMSLFNDANVTRSELDVNSLEKVEVLEDLAAAYMVVYGYHPVEAVTLAHLRLSKAKIGSIINIIELAKKAAIVDAIQDSQTKDVVEGLQYKQHLSIVHSLHACMGIYD